MSVTQSLPNQVALIHSMSRYCPGRNIPVVDWASMSRTSPIERRAPGIVDIRISSRTRNSLFPSTILASLLLCVEKIASAMPARGRA